MELKKLKITPEVENEIKKGTEPISLILHPDEENNFNVEHVVNEICKKLPDIDKGTVRKTDHYVFVELTPNQIEALKDEKSIKKFWLDKKITTMTADSQNEVKLGPPTVTSEQRPFCNDIIWAVIDDGVDASHEALVESKVESYNFTKDDSLSGGHGTHVAGIIGGWCQPKNFQGLAPQCQLYNFKIVGKKNGAVTGGGGYEVIKAFDKIQEINRTAGKIVISGANLSWGISITNTIMSATVSTPYQPGLSPICIEANRLVNSGVILCVAAGNYGSQAFLIPGKQDPPQEFWAGFVFGTIADPGTAELPITVGSTHAEQPDRYGISFFSSKGPTADGRIKPDMVAPGENIYSSIPNNQYMMLTGTSQATPYVSGVAAQLLHAYPQLIGQPYLVKQILMRSCRTLNRSVYFQGNGLVDIHMALKLAGSMLTW